MSARGLVPLSPALCGIALPGLRVLLAPLPASAQQNNHAGAIADLRAALKLKPDHTAALKSLQDLGIAP